MKTFVLNVIALSRKLPNTIDANIFKKQLIRSASSEYANYRAANRARSKAEFFSKICITVKEADETKMWLDLLIESNISNNQETINLHSESLELLKIMSKIRKNLN